MADDEEVAQTLSREDLYELVWSKPMLKLAKDFGISDVALALQAARHSGAGSRILGACRCGAESYRPKLPKREAQRGDQHVRLLARFLEREGGELRPWTPLEPGEQRFWRLLKRRAAVVRSKVQLHQSLAGLEVLQEEAAALVAHCEQMIRKLDRALLGEAKQLGWSEWVERCQGIPGVGSLTAMALVASWRRASSAAWMRSSRSWGWTFESDRLVAGKAGAS